MSSSTKAPPRQTNPHRLNGPVTNPWRTANAETLAQALSDTRQRTLGLIQAWQAALPDLAVPPLPGMNPPLWEWGHIAWFQEWWTVRNRQRCEGTRSASLGDGFGPSLMPRADALYNSSEVAHDSRWSLPLPDLQHTLRRHRIQRHCEHERKDVRLAHEVVEACLEVAERGSYHLLHARLTLGDAPHLI